ncbi:hypothetical protein EKK58_03665 [Candidatus Dependentiae bacterium]|nr:MAG: hypothetical protein EKK58_03665 [Candidatus Dependentiae bacterium]
MKIRILYLFFMCVAHKTWATVVWNGTSQPNAINENLEITNDCQLTDSPYIVAESCDVTVTVKSSALIKAQKNFQEIGIVAVWPYTVTFKVEHDLAFEGVELLETEPLYIYLFGNSQIRWEVKDGKKLTFNKTKTSGPTELWVSLFGEGQPVQIFKAYDKKQISFGENCLIGYAILGNIQWTSAYTIQSSTYNPSSSKDYPHITFDEGSQLNIEIIND